MMSPVRSVRRSVRRAMVRVVVRAMCRVEGLRMITAIARPVAIVAVRVVALIAVAPMVGAVEELQLRDFRVEEPCARFSIAPPLASSTQQASQHGSSHEPQVGVSSRVQYAILPRIRGHSTPLTHVISTRKNR